jgi:hypothetical protein
VAKAYQTAIDEAREILQDSEVPYRFADPLVLNLLNRALQELGRIRPDAFWATFDADDIVVPEVTDLTVTFPLPMQFYLPVVSFIVAWAEIVEDEFTQDGRASILLQQFKTQVMSL